jgi:hypothetical protein
MNGSNRHWAMQISMHNLQWQNCMSSCLVYDPVLLSSSAWLTDRIRVSRGVNLHAKYNIRCGEFLHLIHIEVGKATMPEIISQRKKG